MMRIRGKRYEYTLPENGAYLMTPDDGDEMTRAYLFVCKEGKVFYKTLLEEPYGLWSDRYSMAEWEE